MVHRVPIFIMIFIPFRVQTSNLVEPAEPLLRYDRRRGSAGFTPWKAKWYQVALMFVQRSTTGCSWIPAGADRKWYVMVVPSQLRACP
jgi:hypothetical protein